MLYDQYGDNAGPDQDQIPSWQALSRQSWPKLDSIKTATLMGPARRPRSLKNSWLRLITFLNMMHLKFGGPSPLTRGGRESILSFHEHLLPDDVLSLHVQRCVSHDTYLWPEEFPDLAVAES